MDFDRLEGGLLGISCIGRERVRVVEAWREPDGLNRGRVLDIAADPVVPVPPDQAWLAEMVLQVLPEADETYRHVERRDDAAWVANRLAELLPLSLTDRQALLELVRSAGAARRARAGGDPQPRLARRLPRAPASQPAGDGDEQHAPQPATSQPV